MGITQMGNLYLCERLFFGGLKRKTLPYGVVKYAEVVLLLKHSTCCGWFHVGLVPYVDVVQVNNCHTDGGCSSPWIFRCGIFLGCYQSSTLSAIVICAQILVVKIIIRHCDFLGQQCYSFLDFNTWFIVYTSVSYQ